MIDKTCQVTKEEIELLIRKLSPVKAAGYGELLIQVQAGNIVYIKQSIGEQIKMDLKTEP